jgi:hypothetical protein
MPMAFSSTEIVNEILFKGWKGDTPGKYWGSIVVRCAFCDRKLHSRSTIVFHPLLRLKRSHACDQCKFLAGVRSSYQNAL